VICRGAPRGVPSGPSGTTKTSRYSKAARLPGRRATPVRRDGGIQVVSGGSRARHRSPSRPSDDSTESPPRSLQTRAAPSVDHDIGPIAGNSPSLCSAPPNADITMNCVGLRPTSSGRRSALRRGPRGPLVGRRIGRQPSRHDFPEEFHVDVPVLSPFSVPGKRHLAAVRRETRGRLRSPVGRQRPDRGGRETLGAVLPQQRAACRGSSRHAAATTHGASNPSAPAAPSSVRATPYSSWISRSSTGRSSIGLPAPAHVLLQATHDQAVEVGRHARDDLTQRLRLLLQHGRQRGTRRSCLRTRDGRQHLVKDGTEAEDVRPRVDCLPSACSGDMYGAVPTTKPGAVTSAVADVCASPEG